MFRSGLQERLLGPPLSTRRSSRSLRLFKALLLDEAELLGPSGNLMRGFFFWGAEEAI